MKSNFSLRRASAAVFVVVGLAVIVSGIVLFSGSPAPTIIAPPTDGKTAPVTSTVQRVNTPTSSNSVVSVANNPRRDGQHLAPNPKRQIEEIQNEVPYYLLSTVNDPYFDSNWANATVQTKRAWDLTTGSSSTKVAVIDTGYAMDHQDLSAVWATNAGESGQTELGQTCWTGVAADKSSNSCDDDDNGYVDDWRGYDFWSDDNSPQAGEENPDGDGTTHGSMVAGVIAATANNNLGGAGVNQQTKILPLQVFSDDSEAYTSSLVAAIYYAAQQDVDVINLSLGTSQYDSVLLDAIQAARASGVMVVAASGNCALNDEPFCNPLEAPGRMTYPALYPSVLAVGATTSNGVRASYSSYGPLLDIVAPGSNIGPLPFFIQGSDSIYANASGTSFASPLVAGIATLLIAQSPSSSISQIEDVLLNSTTKPSAMSGQNFTNEYGFGVVNAHRATLLNQAISQSSSLGTGELSARAPASGAIWRAATGTLDSDESIVIGCRTFPGDTCQATLEKSGTILRYTSTSNAKSADNQYFLVKASDLTSGSWNTSVHNREYGRSVGSLVR